MRYAILSALLTVTVANAEPATPNTLSPKEIADGWILLFDGHSTFGWATEGEVTVSDGILKLGGRKATTIKTLAAFAKCECRYEMSADGKKWTAIGFNRTKDNEDTDTHHIQIQTKPEETKYYRSVKLKPLGMESLFNGKDLTGWRVFPGTKERKVTSVFSVTKEGWLNVKNGPGDIQTESQWADFVVQLECISNGKYLNSGLFFRCLPNVYQQGYEAQIRNEWMGDDRTKPVDFGTGAIYRRQAARKVVSTDGEWFTMTVAAHGKHLATWVNGYPVASWTDDRKEADNGRNGAKITKGALSIQGHDPTTDLSFRNIRIQSLDKK